MLKDNPASARPREKLLALGPAALADAELIALLLRTGLVGTSVLQLAEQMLGSFGGLAGLLRADPEQLKRIKGLGPAKRAELAAVLELARRSIAAELGTRPLFDCRLIRLEEMFRGTLTQTSVYPREVVKRALELGAAAVIMAHNHPSGAAQPSRADEFLTHTLKSALALVDVRVLDHLVVGQGHAVSFAERGLL